MGSLLEPEQVCHGKIADSNRAPLPYPVFNRCISHHLAGRASGIFARSHSLPLCRHPDQYTYLRWYPRGVMIPLTLFPILHILLSLPPMIHGRVHINGIFTCFDLPSVVMICLFAHPAGHFSQSPPGLAARDVFGHVRLRGQSCAACPGFSGCTGQPGSRPRRPHRAAARSFRAG